MLRRTPVSMAVAVLLAACGGTISAADAGVPPFPECEADAYAFVGDTTLGAIGLRELWPEEAGRAGEIWVTAGPPDPRRWPGGPGEPPMLQRIICLEFDDGSGMSGPVPDDWTSPTAGVAIPTEAGSPISILAVVVAVAVIAGVSLLAFGWRPGGRASRES